MSTKYNFSYIRNAVITQAELAYPKDLNSMEKRSFSAFFRDYESIADCYEFQLLAVAVQCDLKTILPMLYVDCATAPIDVILKASNRINLGKEQTEKLLRGHEHMVEYVRRYGINQFLPQHYCSMSCSQARGTLLQNYVIIPPEFPIQRLLPINGHDLQTINLQNTNTPSKLWYQANRASHPPKYPDRTT